MMIDENLKIREENQYAMKSVAYFGKVETFFNFFISKRKMCKSYYLFIFLNCEIAIFSPND